MRHAPAENERHSLTLPLQCEKWQRDSLDKMFRAGCDAHNSLVSQMQKAMKTMQRTTAWKTVQSDLHAIYQRRDAELESATTEKEKAAIEHKYKTALADKYKVKNELMREYKFSDYGFKFVAKKWNRYHKGLLPSDVVHNIAANVWQQFETYFYGDGEQIKFCPWTEFRSLTGRNNGTAIRYKDGLLYVSCGKKMREAGIPVKMAKAPKNGALPSSSYLYEQEALSHEIKYCRIIREPGPNPLEWRYFVQIVLVGQPPVKVKPKTGELLHPMGTGRVGLDIGTQTLAYAADGAVGLTILADKTQNIEDELRRIERAMGRSRRATNPQFFHEDGTVIRKDKLPPGLLNTRGKRNWVESKRYQQLAWRKRYLLQKQAKARKLSHNELANKVMATGDKFFVEKMNFLALAKKAKPQQKEDLKPGEKFKRRKRFGKSISNRAPAMFLTILKAKIERYGGTFSEINTWKARASQYNHADHTYKKKKLWQRWAILEDGIKVQRDLYSAFLIQHIDDTLEQFNDEACKNDFVNFYTMHNMEIKKIATYGTKTVSSMGIKAA